MDGLGEKREKKGGKKKKGKAQTNMTKKTKLTSKTNCGHWLLIVG